VGFEVSAEAYGQFMGRFSAPLAEAFIQFVGIEGGQTALDVGCGAGALTGPLIETLGVANVAALDPSSAFVSSLRKSHPDWSVRQGSAQFLPFADEQFDRTSPAGTPTRPRPRSSRPVALCCSRPAMWAPWAAC
jgi:trans-aconitate methyltransferase